MFFWVKLQLIIILNNQYTQCEVYLLLGMYFQIFLVG